jgi:hypothetical protein
VAPSPVQQYHVAELTGRQRVHEVDRVVFSEALVGLPCRLNEQFFLEDLNEPHVLAGY